MCCQRILLLATSIVVFLLPFYFLNMSGAGKEANPPAAACPPLTRARVGEGEDRGRQGFRQGIRQGDISVKIFFLMKTIGIFQSVDRHRKIRVVYIWCCVVYILQYY